jgi:hypothetical protein
LADLIDQAADVDRVDYLGLPQGLIGRNSIGAGFGLTLIGNPRF